MADNRKFVMWPDGRLYEVLSFDTLDQAKAAGIEVPEPAPAEPARHIGSVERLAIWWHASKRGADSEC